MEVTISSQTIKAKPFSNIVEQLLSPYAREEFSVITGRNYLFIDTAAPISWLNATELEQACAVLKQLPCPVIGLTDATTFAAPSALLSALDVVVTTEESAAPLVRNILKSPWAAMTLVQLLRHNENASIDQGLFAESLAYATLQGGTEFQNFVKSRKASKKEIAAAGQNSHGVTIEPAVITERRKDKLWLTLNRPEQRNAYSIAMRDQLIEGLQLLANDLSIKRAIICGAGACFCVGGDLNEFGLFDDTATAHAIRSTRNAGKLIAELADRIECRVHRVCIGSGIELPAFCQRIVATKETIFQLPEITMGMIPGAGGTVSVLQRIGRQRTAYFALSAKKIDAQTALEWGLIDAIDPDI